MSTISELLIKIGADSSGLRKELNDSKQQIQNTFGDTSAMNQMQGALTATSGKVEALIGTFTKFAGLAAGGFGLTALVQGAVQAGEGVYQLSQRLQVSTAEASEFKRILSMTGGDVDTAAKAIMRLDSTLSSGGSSAKKADDTLKAFGASLKDQNGNLLPLNKQLEQLAIGYQNAQKAGQGQAYIMNTLGTRGMTLVKTLQEYTEAKEDAAKIQSIGLNPQEMHELNRQIRVVNGEFAQLKLASGAALAPLVEEILPPVLKGLQETAKFIKQNHTELAALTKTLATMYAIYKGVQAVQGITRRVGTLLGGSSTSKTNTSEEQLTKQQERAIKRRIANIQKQATAEEKAYQKTVAAMEVSEAEKTRLVTEYTVKRETIAAEAAERERAIMTSMFQAVNAQRAADTAKAVASYSEQAAAAAGASEKIVAANTAASESAKQIVVSNGQASASEVEKAAAAVSASEEIVTANAAATASVTEQTLANGRLTAAETEAGAASVAASERTIAGQTAAKAATVRSTAAQGTLTAATVATGTQATVAGARMVTAAGKGIGIVGRLTSAVSLLAGGWIGVAMAIAYAAYALYQFNHAQLVENRRNTVTYDGNVYQRNGEGNWVLKENVPNDDEVDEDGLGDDPETKGGYHTEYSNVYSDDLINTLEDLRIQNGLDRGDETIIAEKRAKDAQKEAEEAAEQAKALAANISPGADDSGLANMGGGGGNSASAPAAVAVAPPPTKYTQEVPIGDIAAQIAQNNFSEGEQWMGNLTDNPRIQCDSFTANIYNQAGIGNIGGYDTASSAINDSAFRNAGAYHEAGDGYTPQAGDLVDSAHHVGIYMGNGMVRSRDSSGGVTTWNINDWDNQFGITGYGSISEATGGRTVEQETEGTSQQAAAARAKQEHDRKLSEAYKQSHSLYTSMVETVTKNDGYDTELEIQKWEEDIKRRQAQINKIAGTPDIDPKTVQKLENELKAYAESTIKQIADKQKQARSEMTDAAKKATAEMRHDYEAEAEAEYQATVRKLDKERKDKEKSLMRDKNDWETKHIISDWYYAQVEEAENKLLKSRQEAHEKYVKYLEEEGSLAELVQYLGSDKGRNRTREKTTLDGQQRLAKQYAEVWEAATGKTADHIAGYIATVAEDLYGTMTDSLEEFIKGTRSASSAIRSFGNSVLSSMAKIAANRLAANWMTGILGGVSHMMSRNTATQSFGWTGNVLTGFNKTYFPMAKGGIVTAPTLAMIGEAGDNEAVIPLNHENLSALGGGKGGGVVVNITNKTNSNVRVDGQSYDDQMQRWVLNVVVDGASRNVGGFGRNLKTALGGQM